MEISKIPFACTRNASKLRLRFSKQIRRTLNKNKITNRISTDISITLRRYCKKYLSRFTKFTIITAPTHKRKTKQQNKKQSLERCLSGLTTYKRCGDIPKIKIFNQRSNFYIFPLLALKIQYTKLKYLVSFQLQYSTPNNTCFLNDKSSYISDAEEDEFHSESLNLICISQ